MIRGFKNSARKSRNNFTTDRTDNTDGWMRPELGLNQSSALDSNGRTIWIMDAHRDGGKRFVVHADEMLTAFFELDALRIR
jgi:hypothetical protein